MKEIRNLLWLIAFAFLGVFAMAQSPPAQSKDS